MEHDICQLCGTKCICTKHHLIPQSKAKSGKYKQIKDDPSNHLWICRSCHDQIHALYENNILRDVYNTFESLMAAPEFAKYVKWKKKHPDFKGHSKMSNTKKYK